MARKRLPGLCGLSLLLTLAGVLLAQPSAKSETGPAAEEAVELAGLARLLTADPVRKGLGFTEDQDEKLKRAFQSFSQQQQQHQQDYPNLQNLSADQRQKAEQAAKRHAEQFGRQLAAILTAEQEQELQQLNFRLTAFTMLANPAVLQQIGLTQEQQQELEKARTQLQEQVWQLQQQAAKQSLGVLNAQQLTKLRNLQEQALRQQSQPAGAPPQPVQPAR